MKDLNKTLVTHIGTFVPHLRLIAFIMPLGDFMGG
jgi:hypothetical protein